MIQKKSRKPLTQSETVKEVDTAAQSFVFGNRAEKPAKKTGSALPIEALQPRKNQPRRYFDEEKIEQLMRSIKEHGVLEPLIVRPIQDGRFEIVAGERRYRAAQKLNLAEVPVVVREFDDQQALQVALIENLQREDLNPVEETESILELLAIKIDGTTQDVISTLSKANHAKNRGQELEENVFLQLQTIESTLAGIGRFTAESFRTSRLPLLNLPDDVLQVLRAGKIEFTKARAIAKVKDEKQRKELLESAIKENLSLSQIKERVSELTAKPVQPDTLRERFKTAYREIANSPVWDDPKQQRTLEKLLSTLEKLIAESR